jgi:hypothetical protein
MSSVSGAMESRTRDGDVPPGAGRPPPSCGSVRWLHKIGQLKTGMRDRNGTFTYDRREVEEMARKRGLGVKPSGELTARVFKLFEAKRSFPQICIETEQEPDVIQALWERFQGGFDYGKKLRDETEDSRRQREHDNEMRAMDRELERRRRGDLSDENRMSPVRAQDRSVRVSESGSSES